MSISHYIKEIGRGKDGARALTREQAQDLFAQILDDQVSELEIGGFCLAMRIKGETAAEMAGFIDATRQRLSLIPASPGGRSTVVLPSYNGARKLPLLTPLLAQLLVERGLRVVIHGLPLDPGRTTSAEVLTALGLPWCDHPSDVRDERVNFLPIERMSAGLRRLLDVRRVVGLRNSAHSLVKLVNPCAERALVVGSYTHPEYLLSMSQTYSLIQADALLSRGIEGEAVADARRLQQIDAFIGGQAVRLQQAQSGPIASLPDWPKDIDAASIARYTEDVLAGRRELPTPIARQIAHIERACLALRSGVLPDAASPLVPASPAENQT